MAVEIINLEKSQTMDIGELLKSLSSMYKILFDPWYHIKPDIMTLSCILSTG